MWETANRLFSAAVRVLGATLLGCTVLPLCAVLLAGCSNDDEGSYGKVSYATVQLAVGANPVDMPDGTPTEAESKLHTLRVYAFVEGQPAGHYFTDNVTIAEDKTHKFYMDLKFYTAGVQQVDFYVVANEGSMALKMAPTGTGAEGNAVTLSETTTETELNGCWFNNRLSPTLAEKGLPMYCKMSVALDFANLSAQTPSEGSGHEGHPLLEPQSPIVFGLERPMGKIGIFAAKAAGETGELKITGLTMQLQGTPVRNYLMKQDDGTLKMILGLDRDFALPVVSDPVTAQMASNAEASVRRNPANYTPVMAEPFYPFENPWENGGNWAVEGTETREHAVEIEYTFDDGAPRRRTVYLPRVERNHYYAICCLIHNDGRIVVTYTVADWDVPVGDGYDENGEYQIDFDYPQYTNPLMPQNGAALTQGQQYAQPEVWYNPSKDENSADYDLGSMTFKFEIKGPVNLPWNPVMHGATTDDFEIRVYQRAADGSRVWKDVNKTTDTPTDDLLASADPYYIMVRAANREYTIRTDAGPVNRTLSLGIAYARNWHPNGSSLLLINGLTHDLKWAGSSLAEYVIIKQVDVPAGHKVEDEAVEEEP